jgi:hypothetical protein
MIWSSRPRHVRGTHRATAADELDELAAEAAYQH